MEEATAALRVPMPLKMEAEQQADWHIMAHLPAFVAVKVARSTDQTCPSQQLDRVTTGGYRGARC